MFLIMMFETSTRVWKPKKFCCGFIENIASLSFNGGNLIKFSGFTTAPF